VLKPQVEIDRFKVRVRGPRETIERIADRLMSADYPYSTVGSLSGVKYAEFIVTFDGLTEAQWFAGIASDALVGEALAESDAE